MKPLNQSVRLVLLSSFAAFALALSVHAQSTATNAPSRTVGYATNQFDFKGGTLGDLMKAIHAVYGVDLLERGTVPAVYLSQIKVPKLGLPFHPIATPYTAVLKLYNDLSRNGFKGLGTWFMDAPHGPQTVVFIPPAPDELDLTTRIRAFSIVAKTEAERKAMEDVLLTALEFYQQERKLKPEGHFRYHQATSLLIAVGDDAYLNAVSEVVKALKETKN